MVLSKVDSTVTGSVKDIVLLSYIAVVTVHSQLDIRYIQHTFYWRLGTAS
jgi:hypothetical protein